jgi:hypothetical protein
MDKEKTIIEILRDIEEYAGKDHYIEDVIEEKGLFWRIRLKWAKRKAKEIIKIVST